jgi:raffinose/stachyose/melibiose transport system substrate-binding protein
MKKSSLLIAIMLVVSIMFSAIGCGKAVSDNTSNSTVASSSDNTAESASTGTSTSAQETTATEPKASGEISLTAINGGDNEVKAFNEIIENFQKESAVKVKLEELPSSNDYENIIKTRFATNDPPDIFYFWSGANQYQNMKADTSLVDLTNENFVNDLTDAIKTYQTVDGKIYGIPWGSYNAMGAFYNKNVFSKLNINIPNNYNEFLDICKTVKAAGITPVFEGAGTVWPTQIFSLCGFQTFVTPAIGGEDGVQKLTKNEIKLKDMPALKDVFTRYYALNKSGYMNKDLASATYDQEEKALSSGTAAMVFQADWMLPDIQTKYNNADDIGYFPLPSDTDKGVASLYPTKQIFISKDGKNVPAALEFARYMTKTDSLNIWYKYNPGITVYKSATSSQYTAQKDIMQYINSNKGMIQIQLRTAASFTDFDKICQELIITGNVDKAVQKMNDAYLKDGKDKQIAGF